MSHLPHLLRTAGPSTFAPRTWQALPSCSVSSCGRRSFHPTPPSSSASPPLDLYAVMGLERKASKKEIKERFYELSKKYHPDLCPDDAEAKQKYLDISAAYDTLGNPSKRNQYDNSTSGRAAHYSSPSARPNLTRTGRQSAWVHPATRQAPRARGAGPSAAWSGRRPGGFGGGAGGGGSGGGGPTGHSTGHESPLRGTSSSFGPYGDPNTLNHAAWDHIAQQEFSMPLRRSPPSLMSRAVPTFEELSKDINVEGVKAALGLVIVFSVAIGLIAGVQGTALWEQRPDANDRRRSDDDSRLAKRRPEEKQLDGTHSSQQTASPIP